MSNSGTIVPIFAPRTAIHIIASAKLQTEDEELQKQEFGFLFKDASDDIKLNVGLSIFFCWVIDTNLCQIADLFGTFAAHFQTVCNALDGLVIQSGSTVAGPAFRSCLSISVRSID